MTEQVKKIKRKLDGVVISDMSNQSLVISVERRFKHKTYNKYISKTKKYHAHDVENKAKIGDKVTIIESKPHSKLKKWELLTIN